jgi:hypothetical protein
VFPYPGARRLIREKCVPLVRNCLLGSGYESDARFWDKLQAQGAHLGNSRFLCTAGGKALGDDLEKALKAFARLPESERRPGAVTVEDRGPRRQSPPQAPPGTLVIKTYVRALARDAGGPWQVPRRVMYGKVVPTEPNRDFLWLTAAEWQALLPARPFPGDAVPVPASVRDRLVRFHLVDIAGGLSGFWKPEEVRAEEFTLRVEEASAAEVRLRLRGTARLGRSDREAVAYEVLGNLTYDRAKKALTRFDAVALSEKGHTDRATKTLAPLGIAFELAAADAADARIPPYGTWEGVERYLNTGR